MTMAKAGTDIRTLMFTYRSYTPIPFLLVMIWFAEPTLPSLLAGFAVVFIGEMIRFWGVSIVGAETRTTGAVGGTFLITNGPFSYVRNPLYLGNMLLYAGVGIMSLALFPWMLLVAVVWFYIQYYLIVTREEEYLGARFGEEFDVYRRNVRRFLPRLTPYRSPHPTAKTAHAAEGLESERRTLQAIALVIAFVVGKYIYIHVGG